MEQRIEIEVKTVVKEDGTTKFSGLVISRKNKEGDQIEEITITEKEDVQSIIHTLETITSNLRKAIGLKEEEKGLENLINIIVEGHQASHETSEQSGIIQKQISNPVWSCGDMFPKCIGCHGCGGLTGEEVALAMDGRRIQAIKAFRDRTSTGLREAKLFVEGWFDEYNARKRVMDGNI